jgi:HK97 family phage major capsid protein
MADKRRLAPEVDITRDVARLAAPFESGARELEGASRELQQEHAADMGIRGGGLPGSYLFQPYQLTRGLKARGLDLGTWDGSLNEMNARVLRAVNPVGKLGATFVTGLKSDVAIMRPDGVPTVEWLAEGAGATGGQVTLGQTSLVMKRAVVMTDVHRAQLLSGGATGSAWLENVLLDMTDAAVTDGALAGVGHTAEPLGLLNSTIPSFSFGGAATEDKIIAAEQTVADADGEKEGRSGWVTSPAARAKLRKLARTGGGGVVWGDDNRILGHPAIATTAATGDRMVFGGDWKELLIGFFGPIEMVVDPYTLASNGRVRLIMTVRMDVAVRTAACFVKSSDSAAQ